MSNGLSLFQLVVVGSSAGGIEALSTLVATLPADFTAPVVIAQHLDPARPSHLAQILARRAHLPVITVQDHELLAPGTIYVVPSNSHVAITDHDLALLPDAAGRPKPSVDLLLSSAAPVFGEQLIAVILTGTGSDGTAGALAVKQAGGTVIIQDPDTAAYPGMPQSLAPETVDVVAELPQIGPLLHRLLAGEALPPYANGEPELHALLEQLHAQSGLDFRLYKRATILRRLQRRIVTTNSGDLAGYQAYLAANPDEQQRLISSFLIKVTQFMRDPEVFDYLRAELLPALHAALPAQNAQLRLWSAGCATGEEAYSLAILLCEELGGDLERVGVKIFATDVDADAITFARHGVYPAAALATLPPDLVARYFVRSSDSYTVTKRVRGLVVFGEHDLSRARPSPTSTWYSAAMC
jgi:two-component system CheB/CheR fusion protein